ncbi:MAG: hypothetical protein K5764_01295, partial [Prevotella sp.]|nr:hypothetical protein [Prevotella sp.]
MKRKHIRTIVKEMIRKIRLADCACLLLVCATMTAQQTNGGGRDFHGSQEPTAQIAADSILTDSLATDTL